MSDESVAQALRSNARRVVVEAPAGTGKTYQAASYARDLAPGLAKGQRALILAHTHAACDVFSSRTTDLGSRLRIGTIDSLVSAVAKAYHRSLDLPDDIHAWSVDRGGESYQILARLVRGLLEKSASVSGAIVERHPVIICDEHQDASADQHGIIEALAQAGAQVRYFGDPMQDIYTDGRQRAMQKQQWDGLVDAADEWEDLDTAHRWRDGSPDLGAWVLEQREALRAGGRVNLSGALPGGLHVHHLENRARAFGDFQPDTAPGRAISRIVRNSPNLLVLTPHLRTVFGLHAYFGRQLQIWEGYTREALSELLKQCRLAGGDAVALGKALCEFVKEMGVGLSASAFGDKLMEELESGCAKKRRSKPADIQAVAKLLLADPSHVGVGTALDHLHHLIISSEHFDGVRIDLRREFSEARRIRSHPDVNTVLAGLAHQRGGPGARIPERAISTIHKSKGLETRIALLVPCDQKTLADNDKNRCLMYVALSRASTRLDIVASRETPSPLLKL